MGAGPDHEVSFGCGDLRDLGEESCLADTGLAKHVNPVHALRGRMAILANQTELLLAPHERSLRPEWRVERGSERAIASKRRFGPGKPRTTLSTEILGEG
jgi:hypothetical protein